MNQKFRRMLSILLIALMMISVVPSTAFAASTISSVTIRDIDTPVHGASPDTFATVASTDQSKYTISSVVWVNAATGNTVTGTFSAGNSYRVKIYLRSQTGYEFKSDIESITSTVNGQSAGSSRVEQGSNMSMCVTKTYTCPDKLRIKSVTIKDVVTPMDGKTPEFKGTVTSTGCDIVNIQGSTDGYQWYDVANSKVMSRTDKFVAGNEYIYNAFVRADTGYLFADADEISAKITTDKFTGSADVFYVNTSSDVYREISKTFTCGYIPDAYQIDVDYPDIIVKDKNSINIEVTPYEEHRVRFFVSGPPASSGFTLKGKYQQYLPESSITNVSFSVADNVNRAFSKSFSGNPGETYKADLHIYVLDKNGKTVSGGSIDQTLSITVKFKDIYEESKDEIFTETYLDGTKIGVNGEAAEDVSIFEEHTLKYTYAIPKDLTDSGYKVKKVGIQDQGIAMAVKTVEPVLVSEDDDASYYSIEYKFTQGINSYSRAVILHMYFEDPLGNVIASPLTNRTLMKFATYEVPIYVQHGNTIYGGRYKTLELDAFSENKIAFKYKLHDGLEAAGYRMWPWVSVYDADGNCIEEPFHVTTVKDETGYFNYYFDLTGTHGETVVYRFALRLAPEGETTEGLEDFDFMKVTFRFDGSDHISYYATAVDGVEYATESPVVNVNTASAHTIDYMWFVSDSFAEEGFTASVIERGVTPFMQETIVDGSKFVFVKDVEADNEAGTPAGKIYKYTVNAGTQVQGFVYEREFTVGWVDGIHFNEMDKITVKLHYTDNPVNITTETFKNVHTGAYLDGDQVNSMSKHNVTEGTHTVQFNYELPAEAAAAGCTLVPYFYKDSVNSPTRTPVSPVEYDAGKFYFKTTVSEDAGTERVYGLALKVTKYGEEDVNLPYFNEITLNYVDDGSSGDDDIPSITNVHLYAEVDGTSVGVNPAVVDVEAGSHEVEFFFSSKTPLVTGYYVEYKLRINDEDAEYINATYGDGFFSYSENITVAENSESEISLIVYLYGPTGEVVDEVANTVTLRHTSEEEMTYTITFDANGGSGSMAAAEVKHGENYTLPSSTFSAPAGKEFKAWEITGTEYAAGDVFSIDNTSVSAVTAKAVWKDADASATTYTIIFAANGAGGTMNNAQAYHGTEYVLPECAFTAPEGKEFDAWDYQGSKYAPGNKLTVTDASVTEVTIKALWKDKTPSSGEYLKGDVNRDGAINAVDATQILRYANGKSCIIDTMSEAEAFARADIDSNGKINAADATQILRKANGKTSIFDSF